jgi:hypothetical protein
MAKDKDAEAAPAADENATPLPLTPVPPPIGDDEEWVAPPPPEAFAAEVAAETAAAEPAVDPLVQAKQDNPVVDALGGVLDGVFKAGDATQAAGLSALDTVKSAAGSVAAALVPSKANELLEWGDDTSFTDGQREAMQDTKNGPVRAMFRPATIGGNITSGVSQFAVGMIGAGKFLKGAQLLQGTGKALTIGRGMVTGAMADATVFDHEARLSDLIEQYPSLSMPITRYLKSDPNDSQAEDRMKNVLEGAMLGGAVETLTVIVRGIRQMRAARAQGGKEAADEAAVALADELEALQTKQAQPVEVPAELPKFADEAAKATAEAPKNLPQVGMRVSPKDRNNIGTIESIEGSNVTIHFVSPEGREARKVFDVSEIHRLDDAGVGTPFDAVAKAVDETPGARAPDGTLLVKNTPSPEQGLKDYIQERLAKGSDFDPGHQRDFNAAKQVTTNGAKQAIALMSDAMAPEIDKLKGGVQSFETIRKLADLANESPEAVMARMSARAKDAKKMASDVVATEEVMILLARQISEEARRIDNGVVKSNEFLNKMQDELSSCLSDLKAVKTAAARTTGAGRMLKSEAAKDPIISAQLKALIACGGDLEKVARIVEPPPASVRAMNAHNEYWINAILSGPKTHIVNITSNLLNTVARPFEKALGGNLREGAAEFMGMARGIKDSIAMAARSGYMEEAILDARATQFEGMGKAISAQNLGVPKGAMGTAVDWLGKAIRLPTRMLLTSDEFFKQLNYRASVYSKATREGLERNLEGKQLAEYIETRFASAFDGTGKGLDEGALAEARIATFTEDLLPGSFANALQGVTKKHPAARLILPFVKTPTNIVKQLGWRTPGLNMLMKSFRAELAAGGGRAAAARGKFVTGGVIWSGAALLAYEGKITGRGPTDPEEKAALLATGWRPYAIKTEDGTYYEYGRLDPFGMAFGLAADFAEARGYLNDDDAGDVALAMGTAMLSNLSSKTYLRGVTEALDAISQPKDRFEKWWQARVGSYVPSGAKQIAGVLGQGDDTMREVRTTLDAIMARTPGLSDNLPPKRNILGEPIRYPTGLGPDAVTPFVASKDLKDTVKTELARLAHGFKLPSEKYNARIDLTKYKNAKGQDAYDRLLELRTIERKGRYTLKERLTNEIESERYQKMPEGTHEYDSKKLDRIKSILGEYHEHTMKRLRREFPTLDRDIKTDDRNVKNVKRKGADSVQSLLNP